MPCSLLWCAEVGQPEAASSSYSWNYDGGSFDWFSQWYPVHAIDHLDSSRPHPVKLMGEGPPPCFSPL